MQAKSSTDFLFRPTQLADFNEIETIAKSARRVPTGLANALQDPSQKMITALNVNGVVIGFLRFKTYGEQTEWTDLVVNPNFLKQEFKLAILDQVKASGPTVTTSSGLIAGTWKSFIKEQAPNVGYRVEEAKPTRSKSLVLHF